MKVYLLEVDFLGSQLEKTVFTAKLPSSVGVHDIQVGYDPDASRSSSPCAAAYMRQEWYDADVKQITAKTWQWVCHVEKLQAPGSYVTADIAGHPIAIVRDRTGELRASFNVCKHRAQMLLSGEGKTNLITCPYHAWTYKLDGVLVRAPHTANLEGFHIGDICLDQVQVEEFCGFVYIQLDPGAQALKDISG